MIKIIDGDVIYAVCGYKEERIREALRVTMFPKPQAPEPPERRLPDGYRYLFENEPIQERDLGFNSRTNTWDIVSNEDIGLFPRKNFFIRKTTGRGPSNMHTQSPNCPPAYYRWVPQGELTRVNDLIWCRDHWGYLPESLVRTPAPAATYVRKI